MSSGGSRWCVYCSIFNLIFYVSKIQVSNLLISNSVWSSWSFSAPHPIYCHLIVSFQHVWLLIVLDSLSWSTRLWSLLTIPVKVIWKSQRRSVKCKLVTCNCCNYFLNLLSLMCQCCCSDFNFVKCRLVTCNCCNHFLNLLSLMCQCCSDFNFIPFLFIYMHVAQIEKLFIVQFFTEKISTQSSFIPCAWDTLFKWSVGICKINWKIEVGYVAVHCLMFYSSWSVCLLIF